MSDTVSPSGSSGSSNQPFYVLTTQNVVIRKTVLVGVPVVTTYLAYRIAKTQTNKIGYVILISCAGLIGGVVASTYISGGTIGLL